ncbi:hypothetical protein [Luteibacter yeojuensis]|uniref:Uncharacterized protein n=1 Tax=Luteibacter yeojuensis TaxID=345309 RepID=A0A0F3KZK1_9GAMM|nr:hypothetical protein [Luteibacter yeojuensis]KJV36397.1 hypothetical protein VI08_04545 [Luteibacter yeojuensis]
MMAGPTWAEAELRRSLNDAVASGRLAVSGDFDAFAQALANVFPFPKGRLDWCRVPGAEVVQAKGDVAAAFVAFLRKAVGHVDAAQQVVVLGDNQVRFAVLGPIDAILAALPTITAFPQHTYVFPYPGVAWCASLTSEHDMCFGCAPARD